MHTRFRRPLHRRSLHRDVPRHPNGHDPHWLQGFPDRVTPPTPSGPGWRHRRRDRPQRRACTALRDTRAPPGPAARRAGDPVRRSARGGAAHREGGRNTVKARECATAQGSEVEDRGRAPAELAARYSGATRTQPREPSRSAGAIRSHSSDPIASIACLGTYALACMSLTPAVLCQLKSCRLYRSRRRVWRKPTATGRRRYCAR